MSTRYELSDLQGNTIRFDQYRDAPDAAGVHWILTGEDGWSGAPPIRGGELLPTTVSGSVPLPAVYGPRAIVLTGVCKAPNPVAYWNAQDRLIALTQAIMNKDGMLTVTNEAGSRQAAVRNVGELLIDPPTGTNAFGFKILLKAHNPRKFGASGASTNFTSPRTTTITNPGSIDTPPIVTVLAPGTVYLRNYTVWTKPYMETTALPAGAVLDFGNRTIKSAAGTDLYDRRTTSSRWWSLVPGENLIESQGTATVEMTYQAAWIS